MSQKEEELNQTIDFFKIENAKLCDQIIKMCHEMKSKDEKRNASSKLLLGKIANYFESKLVLFKEEVEKKCFTLLVRQNNVLNMVFPYYISMF